MNSKINYELKKLHLKERFPKSYAKLLKDKKEVYPDSLYGTLDSWFFSLGFDVIATPYPNGFKPFIKLYENNIFNKNDEFIEVSEVIDKNSEISYRKAIEKSFSLLEDILPWQ